MKRLLIGVIAALAIGLGIPAQAEAGPHDLTRAEIAEGDLSGAVYCEALDKDPRKVVVRAIMDVLQDKRGFSYDGAKNVVEYTVYTYCPQHLVLKSQAIGGPVD